MKKIILIFLIFTNLLFGWDFFDNLFLSLTMDSSSIHKKSIFIRNNTKQVVIDKVKHLMWQDNSATKTITKNWKESINYCKNLDFAGYHDWYLPNDTELLSIVDNKRNPTIKKVFKNIVSDDYWTSIQKRGWDSYAKCVYFKLGSDYWAHEFLKNHIRCVRKTK